MVFAALLMTSLMSLVSAQWAGNVIREVHPALSWQSCTKSGGCQPQPQGRVVLDVDWRWIHSTAGFSGCFNGNGWVSSVCPDPDTRAKNCALEGADYSATYDITTSGTSLILKPTYTNFKSGSRVYLMAKDSSYQIFKLKNQEFTFDVDASNLPCGFDGGLYFTQMDADGGMFKYPSNKSGAKYGTGYCDAKCPRNAKFINGQANLLGWQPSHTDPDTGTGHYGSCCSVVEVWESNAVSAAYLANPCTVQGQTRCSDSECTSYCDEDGCDFSPYRLGNRTYYGRGMTIDTTKKITVVTQFITADNTTAGALREISRLYVQNGKVIEKARSPIPELAPYDSITEKFCSAQKSLFGDVNIFASKDGFETLGDALDSGLVPAMSISGNDPSQTWWLDSNYPRNRPEISPGVARGTC